MMGRKDREGAATRALHRDHDAAGLGDKHLAAGHTGIARLEIVHGIAVLRPDHRQGKTLQQEIGVMVGMGGDFLPSALGGELRQYLPCGLGRRHAVKLRRESRRDLRKEIDLLRQGGADLREPSALGMPVVLGRGLTLGMRGVGTRRGIIPQGLADPVQDDGASPVHRFPPRCFFHSSWKDFGASSGNLRVPVQGRRGSRSVPSTSLWSGWKIRPRTTAIR